ncbi:MAG: PKD domain-containing protein, partial [Bacteroidota bacterium]
PLILTGAVSSIVNVSCNGACDGSATVTASGGTVPYTYLWNATPIQSTATATGLCPGNYLVMLTDTNGCIVMDSVTIVQPPALAAGISSTTHVRCRGGDDGSSTVTATGGTTPYTYSWDTSPAQTDSIATGLDTGIYTVIVSDSNGCTDTVSVTIYQPAILAASITNSVNVSCFSGSDGSATATASGGTAPYIYLWDDDSTQTTPKATGLPAGCYTVTITDDNGCDATANICITEPPLLVANIISTDVSCKGANDGQAIAIATGGTSPYTFSWTPGGQPTDTITVLAPGLYSLYIIDANMCNAIDSIIITEPDSLIAAITNNINSCYGDSTGEATVTPSGGTPPYTYLWDDPPAGGQTDSVATGLPAGTYSVTTTDFNGCQFTVPVFVDEYLPVVQSISKTDIACNGVSDGEATVTVSEELPPYTYLWDDPMSQTTATADSLPAGIYSVTVIDSGGCDSIVSIEILEPAILEADITDSVNVSCFGSSDGWATVTASGGRIPYSYLWNDTSAQTNATATGLPAGIYTATVTDSSGCTTSVDATITEPPLLIANITAVNDVSCNGECDGEIIVIVSGGTPPYTYLWNTTPYQSTDTVTGLCPGSYMITIVDANGCDTAISNIIITQPAVLTVSIGSYTHVSCNGGNDGEAKATASGGTMPYSYLWNTIPAQTGYIATGLPAGTDTVIVTDTNGCADTAYVTINEPSLLTASITDSTNVSCFDGSDGSATVIVSGGAGLYSYFWNDPDTQTTNIATGLLAGTYYVTVTDDNGCDTTDSVIITEPLLLIADITSTVNVSCKEGNDGSATLTASGGTPPYSYLWDDDSVQTSDTAVWLLAGVYTVMITDSLGCDTTAIDTITEPDLLVATVSGITDVACKGDSTGEAIISISGGTPPYIYSWDDPALQTDTLATSLPAGTYNVTVTDSLGCDTIISITVTEPDSLIATITDIININCFGDSSGGATASVSGGTLPYTYLWDIPDTDSIVSGLPMGNYTVIVTDTMGCASIDSVTITQQPGLIITTADDTTICVGMYAIISVSASGGTGSYTYSWSDTLVSGTGPDTLYPGTSTTYVVTVTDSLGCSKTDSVFVSVEPFMITFTVPDSICIGDSTAISVIVTGGDGNYVYSWNTGDSTSSIMVFPETTTYYTITVNDGCGTPTASDSVLVEVNPYPEVGVVPPSPNACGSATISFFDEIAEIPGSYYYWDFGDGALDTTSNPYAVHQYDSMGIFYMSVSVMSPQGCQTNSLNNSMIIISPDPTADFTAAAADTTILLPTIDFTDQSFGDPVIGDTISSWEWDFGDGSTSTQQNPTHTYTDTGTYSVELTVVNQYGCVGTVTMTIYTCADFPSNGDTIVISPSPTADFTAVASFGDFNPAPFITTILFPSIDFTDLSSGDPFVGDTISTWYWDLGNGQTSTIQNPTNTYEMGVYNVVLTIMNEYGCPATVVRAVWVNAEFRVWIPNTFSPNSDGINDIFTLKGIGIKEFEMFIFNRWGQQIFETSDLSIPWDGTVGGGTLIAQQDVYVYMINITDIFGEEHEYIGHVTLIR